MQDDYKLWKSFKSTCGTKNIVIYIQINIFFLNDIILTKIVTLSWLFVLTFTLNIKTKQNFLNNNKFDDLSMNECLCFGKKQFWVNYDVNNFISSIAMTVWNMCTTLKITLYMERHIFKTKFEEYQKFNQLWNCCNFEGNRKKFFFCRLSFLNVLFLFYFGLLSKCGYKVL